MAIRNFKTIWEGERFVLSDGREISAKEGGIFSVENDKDASEFAEVFAEIKAQAAKKE